MNSVVVRLISVYQKWCSPFLVPSCRFHPSCSEYALLLFKRHGFFKALLLLVLRLGKCNPWHEGGVDPVK